MTNRRRNYVAFALLMASLVLGCSTKEAAYKDTGDADGSSESKPIIAATNFALQSMARAIVGDFADVVRPRVQLDPKGGLDVEEVIRIQKATVVLTNGPGADDAAWLNLISLNESRVCATTSEEFELSDFIQVEDYRTVHSHGDEGEHSHPWLVPQCWLNPRLAAAQSLAVRNRLIKAFPDQEADFTANHQSLQEALGWVEGLAGEVAELIEAKRIVVIASDPRLLFFTRSLKTEDNYFLWFEPPEPFKAIAEFEQRKTEDQKRVLLLCPSSAKPLAEELSESLGIAAATVSLIEESEESEGATNPLGYVKKLRANYDTLKTVVEGMED